MSRISLNAAWKLPGKLLLKSSRQYPLNLRSQSTKIVDFDGEVALIYTKFAEQHRHSKGPWNLMLQKLQSLRLKSGLLVDIASGGGEPALTIATKFPEVTVFATDIAPDMVKIAEAKATSLQLKNMKSLIADAEDLSAFDDNSVDVVTCCYGFMFPADKFKAISETYRILKPGGTLIATYWLDLTTFHIVKEMLGAAMGIDNPPLKANPMALSEPGLFDSLLKQAGYSKPIESVEPQYPFDLGTDELFQYKLHAMLIKDKLNDLNAHDVAYKAFKASLYKHATTDSQTSGKILVKNIFVMTSVTK